MTFRRITNYLASCVAADTKTTGMAANALCYVTDTGDIYIYDGISAWTLFRGATKTETLLNKSLTNPNITFDVATGITSGTSPNNHTSMTFKANGAIDFNYTTLNKIRLDPETGSGTGIVAWDVDYTNNYQLGSRNLTSDRTCFLPAITVDGDFLLDNSTATVSNKTISSASNTFQGVSQDPIIKRTGSYMPTVPTTASLTNVGTLQGILVNHTVVAPNTFTTTFDTTEGMVINLTTLSTANQNAGIISPTGAAGIGRRVFGMRARMRSKVDVVAGALSRLYFGFTSLATLPITDTPLATTDHGVIVGFNTTDTNYQIYHNDGATSVTKDAITGPIAKDTNYHTIEISWPAAGNVTVTFDGTAQTVSTDLPATTTPLFFNAVAQNATAAATKTHSIKGIWIEADK